MNGGNFILECITGIQNPVSESIHIRYINVDSERVLMCYCTVGLIKINTLNLRNSICKVMCNKFTCIRTVTFLKTWSNEWTKKFCFFGEVFDWYGSRKKAGIFVLVIFQKINLLYIIVSKYPLNLHQFSLGLKVFLGDKLQYFKPQIWLNQIWNKFLQYIFSGRSSLCIDWYLPWIFHVDFDIGWVHKAHIELW